MKNVKRLVAILTAAVLCMGTAATAFAAEGELLSPEFIKKDGTTPAEVTVTSPSETAKNTLADAAKVKEIFEKSGYEVPANVTMDVIYNNTVTLKAGESAVAVFSAEGADLKAGDTVYALREVKEGTWETLVGTVDSEGKFRFDLTASGNFAVVKVLDSGKVVALDKTAAPDPEKPTPDPEKPTPDPEKPTPDPEKPEGSKIEVSEGVDQSEITMDVAAGKDKDGKPVTVNLSVNKLQLKSEFEKLLTKDEGVKSILNTKYVIPSDVTVETVFQGDFERTDKGNGSVTMYFDVTTSDNNEYFYAVHGITDETGAVVDFEIIECQKDKEGKYYFTLDSFSPVAIVKVTSDKSLSLRPAKPAKPGSGSGSGSSSSTSRPGSSTQVKQPTQLGNTTQSGTNVQVSSSAKTSPKTGEF